VDCPWIDEEDIYVELRNHGGNPSYNPDTLELGDGVELDSGAWGSNPRTLTLSQSGHDDRVIEVSVDEDGFIDASLDY